MRKFVPDDEVNVNRRRDVALPSESCRYYSPPGVSVSCFCRHILVWVEVKDNKRFLSYFVCDWIQPLDFFMKWPCS